MATTTKTQIPDEVNNWYDEVLLIRALPLFIHTLFGQVRDIPRKAGTLTIKFRRYARLTAATTPLSEGITPAGSQLSVTNITGTVAQYGDFITVTDVVDFSSKDPVMTETAEILGEQFADTTDLLTRDVLAAGTSVTYANGTARTDVGSTHKISTVLIRTVVRKLKRNNAKRITRMVDADTGYATAPVDQAFVGIVHPNTTYDLKGLTEFVSVEKYARNAKLLPGEIGKVDEVRFIETTNAKVFTGGGASGIDVYGTIIVGMNAYGVTRISGESVKNIVKPLGSGGTEDPLDQRATSGWKSTFVAKILNDDFMDRLEHAVS